MNPSLPELSGCGCLESLPLDPFRGRSQTHRNMDLNTSNCANSRISREEKFKFDLEGYLVVKNALAPEEVAEMNRIADEIYTEEYDERGLRSRMRVSQWGPPLQALIDHPAALPYLVEFLGPKFRIDHDYNIFMIKGGAHGRIHGGPAQATGSEGSLSNLAVLRYLL